MGYIYRSISGVVTEACIQDARTLYSLAAEHLLGSLFRRAAGMRESRSIVLNWRASLTRAWMWMHEIKRKKSNC